MGMGVKPPLCRNHIFVDDPQWTIGFVVAVLVGRKRECMECLEPAMVSVATVLAKTS